MKQKDQYLTAAERLEDQLLKLKEQREALKQQGQKHEDSIMKENAKLQVMSILVLTKSVYEMQSCFLNV